MATDVATIMAAKAMSRIWPGMCPPSRPPAKAPAMPAAPKIRPVRHITRPPRAWLNTLTAEVTPTTNREAAIASLASNPAT